MTLNLATGVHTGDAAGDILTAIEILHGSAFADTLTGNSSDNILIGGQGGDQLDGGLGFDVAGYITSATGVANDLAAHTTAGGDSQGDVLTGIEDIVGSSFGDRITGDGAINILEGRGGSDLILGGGGADIIYGGVASAFTQSRVPSPLASAEADVLRGQDGNDKIYAAANDADAKAYGGAGSDEITVNFGTAFGDDGNDTLFVMSQGSGWALNGGSGDDLLQFKGGDIAEGGDGGDRLEFYGQGTAHVQDSGRSGSDGVVFQTIATAADFAVSFVGNDLHVSKTGGGGSVGTVIFDGYLAGTNGIEQLFAADGTSIAL